MKHPKSTMPRRVWLLSFLLVLLMVSTNALAVTGINPVPNEMPITTEDITLTIYSGISANKIGYMNSLDGHPVVQAYEEATGIKLKFIHPPQGDDGTFFTTMIASGEYPDIFRNPQTGNFKDYPGGVDGAIDDGILLDISDLVKEYGYNFWQRIDEKGGDSKLKNVLSDSGRVIGLGALFRPPVLDGKPSQGVVVRKEYMDQAGITERPRTVEELTELLRAFKEIGVEVPMVLPKLTDASFAKTNFLSSAFGVTIRDFFLNDEGKVTHGYLEPGYRDFIDTLRLWMEEGLISRDFITGHDNQAMMVNGKGGATWVHTVHTISMHSLGRSNGDFNLLAIQYPRLSDPDAHIGLGNNNEAFTNEMWAVSATCKYPVEAVRFIDYLYSDEAVLLNAWGTGEVDGNVTFTEDADGNRTFTEYAKNNPDMDFNTFRGRWTLGEIAVVYEQQMESQQYDTPECRDNFEKWGYNYDKANQLPMHMTPTADESREIASIMNRVNTYADEAVLKFILGETPMDQYDAFVEQCRKLGLEEAAALNQQAYDRYQAR